MSLNRYGDVRINYREAESRTGAREFSRTWQATCLTCSYKLSHAAAEVARPHVQSLGHERVRVAHFTDRPSVPRYARPFRGGQAENTMQRLDIRHLLAEHRGQHRGGQTEADTLRTSGDHRRDQLPTAATQLPDRPEETRWTRWSQR